MQNGFVQSAVMISVFMLSVVMLTVVTPNVFVLTAERHYPERRYAVSRGSTTGS
jgi:hypothetical protein